MSTSPTGNLLNNWAVKRISVCLVATFLFLLVGCTSLKVKLGWKVYLAKTPVASIETKLPKGPGIAPGQRSPLVVTILQPDGKVLLTEGEGGGKVMWKDIQVAATVVNVSKKGVVSLAKDPRVSDGKMGHVTVTVPSHPGLRADLDIPFRYDIAFSSHFSGTKGSDGSNGMDGTNGTDGMLGSIDPNSPSPGGNGTDGTDGTSGDDGGPGSDGPAVQVGVALQPGAHPLLQVSVRSQGKQKFYLVDPQGGSLTVSSSGGKGGSGGRGGRGGRGGSGGVGTPNGTDGRSGLDGRNGNDGQSGRDGSITVIYDPQAKPYLSALHLPGANGPKPIFQQEAVAAFW